MIVVDTSAIIAVILKEKNSNKIAEKLSSSDLYMSAGTYSELMIVATAQGFLAQVHLLIDALGVQIVPLDAAASKNVQNAFEVWGKGRHKASLNFGDCFAYALAKSNNCPLLFIGNDFSQTDVLQAI